MDYTECFKEVLLQYPFIDPSIEFIRHNENITYKVMENGREDTYLMRMHKPITKNMQGLQNKREAILSELEFLREWSTHSETPVQIPFPNLNGEWVTSVIIDGEEVHCSVLKWIFGETMSKEDFANEETVNALGRQIASLHQFSRTFAPHPNFNRPKYGLEWINTMLGQMRSGEEIGVFSAKEFRVLEDSLTLVSDRLKEARKTNETWGFIHADVHNSNLILTSGGISFIDFGLSGFGFYAMDVAMGAIFVKKELRDKLLSSYASSISGKIDITQLEYFMFLAIAGYYAFSVSRTERHKWIRDRIGGLIEHVCDPLLEGKTETVFYNLGW
jgi:Ser/Thr protein kinase RdoA (MazF antagonist)